MERVADIWQVALDQPPIIAAGCEAILSLSEAIRADRYATRQLRTRFVIGRASVRSILSRYLRVDPRRLSLGEGPHGKPFLPDHQLSFNVSHSHDRMLCAVTRNGPIGIDIERISATRDLHGISRRYFAVGECRRFEELSDCDRIRAFYECWTRKESVIKATGAGLSQDLKSFEVTFGPGAPPRIVSMRHGQDRSEDWALNAIDVGRDFCGAVAYRAPEMKINMRRFEPARELKRLRKGDCPTTRESSRELNSY